MKQPSRPYPQPTQTFYSPPPRQSIPAREIVHRGEDINSFSADTEMMLRLKLMEEGRGGYDSQDFIQNNVHDIESISDVSSIDITESENESSNPIAVKNVPKANSKSTQTNRVASGILRGAGTRPNTPSSTRSVQFRNSPEVRYIT
jgi:hypothetical protein